MAQDADSRGMCAVHSANFACPQGLGLQSRLSYDAGESQGESQRKWQVSLKSIILGLCIEFVTSWRKADESGSSALPNTSMVWIIMCNAVCHTVGHIWHAWQCCLIASGPTMKHEVKF